MTDHEIVWEFDGPGFVRATARCNASLDAFCRNLPACNCEEWGEEGRDGRGWFHRATEWVREDQEVNVKHYHSRPSDCNICTWLNEGDILECTGNLQFEIATTPINPIWMSPGYDWEPALTKDDQQTEGKGS